MQYTLRNIPRHVDEALRRRARRERKSLNQVAIEALSDALGLDAQPVKRRDLSDIAGSWQADPVIEAALDEQRQIDEEMWR